MAAEGIYPLSTQNGQSIPLDIVKPSKLVQWVLAANVAQAVTIPAGAKTAWVYSSNDAILSFNATPLPNSLVATTVYADAIFIPAKTFVNIEVTPGTAYLLGLGAAVFYLNVVTQWAALNQPLQTTTQ